MEPQQLIAHWPWFLAMVALWSISIGHGSYVRRKAGKLVITRPGPAEFAVSKALVTLAIIGVALGVLIFYQSLHYGFGAWSFPAAAAYVLVGLSLAMLYFCLIAKVKFSEDRVTFHDGRREVAIDYKDIRGVSVANGFIRIERNNLARTGFMLIFSNSPEIFARLKAAASESPAD